MPCSQPVCHIIIGFHHFPVAGVITFWLVGFGLASGAGGVFIGTKNFALDEVSGVGYAQFFFQLSLALTAATIVSGAVAERCEFVAYLVYSVVITGGVVYMGYGWEVCCLNLAHMRRIFESMKIPILYRVNTIDMNKHQYLMDNNLKF